LTVEVRAHRLGAALRVAARPGAGRSAILGEHGGALKLALAAPPEKGKANREAVRFLAGSLGVSRSEIEVLRGEACRDKVVLVRGLGAATVSAKIAALLEGTAGG